jgi:hypothetical protein
LDTDETQLLFQAHPPSKLCDGNEYFATCFRGNNGNKLPGQPGLATANTEAAHQPTPQIAGVRLRTIYLQGENICSIELVLLVLAQGVCAWAQAAASSSLCP